jgi:hypothetical protein
MAGDPDAGLLGASRNVTLTAVAREAGVSPATASKALNDRFDVSESTRARVRDVAERLGFVPNALARGLLAGKSHTVGILTNDLQGRFVSRIMFGAEEEIGRERSTVLLANSDGDTGRQAHQLQALLERRVDGLIIVDEYLEERPPLVVRGTTPVVYAFGMSEDPSDVSVVPDVREGGRQAAHHLLALGRTHLAHIGGDITSYSGAQRAQGSLKSPPRRPMTLSSGATTASNGAGTRRDSCSRTTPRRTVFSPATTRSRAVPWIGCSPRGTGCPRTSPSSDTTTGRCFRSSAGDRLPRSTCGSRNSARRPSANCSVDTERPGRSLSHRASSRANPRSGPRPDIRRRGTAPHPESHRSDRPRRRT